MMNVRCGKTSWFAFLGLLGVYALTVGGAGAAWASSCCGTAPAVSNTTRGAARSSALLTGKVTAIDSRGGAVSLQVKPAKAGERSAKKALGQLKVGDTTSLSMTVGADGKPASGTAVAAKYVCPMHPGVVSAKPGQCPHCGMNLELVKHSGSSAMLTGKVTAIDKRAGMTTLQVKPAKAGERSAKKALGQMEVGDTVSLSMTIGADGKPVSGSAVAAKYVCPMHPDVVSDKPGQCPKCGMNLELSKGANGHSHH